ncbi:MAG: hypothetical protein HC859_07790 [Bacteroidia bacterium]|nr:hypothetical protein [Bacteroidia bacterium]
MCSVIVPGVIDTPANRQANPHAMFDDWVTPESIAAAIHYLTSDDAASLREPVLKMYGSA